jgi:hypothetical protein
VICSFLNKTDADTLLIFFNGWGMDTARLQTWHADHCDVLAIHDYTVLSGLPERISRYATIHVVAWSLGVWAAHQALSLTHHVDPRVFKTVLAVNGTLSPIAADTGIPPDVFRGTADHWLDPGAREKFYMRTAGDATALSRRSCEDQQQELHALEQQILHAGPVDSCCFTRAMIGTRDRIFPPAAQRAAWRRWPQVDVVERPLRHDPFCSVLSWSEVLQ